MGDGFSLAAVRRAHFVGIGGTGMSGLARLFLEQGREVSGSDVRASGATDALARAGAAICVGHAGEHVRDPDLVVVSAAVAPDNPEVRAASARRIPVATHAEVLGLLVASGRGIAVAGTHGKTTTTALVGYLLERAGRDPTILAGSEMLNYGASVRLGRGASVVVEADEYDRRFLSLSPRVAVVTSIEPDHLDYYRDLDEIRGAFRAFASRLPPEGALLVCQDDAEARELPAPCPRVPYGLDAAEGWRAADVRAAPDGMRFTALSPTGERATVALPLVGRHNVANAVAALGVAALEGVPLAQAAETLAGFRGTRRRFELLGEVAGVRVVDDYAHHPTAVRATLEAARAQHAGPLWAVFQPHTRNRTRRLLDEFAGAFAAADAAVITAIYEPPGREREPIAISGADLAARITRPPAEYIADLDAAARYLVDRLPPDALLVVMGAGDVDCLGRAVLTGLARAQV
jgi:UDP-N-acetylmuramate--alanine ligase